MKTYRNTVFAFTAIVAGQVAGTAHGQDRSDWPREVAIGSSTIGGVFHVVMTGWAELITEILGVPARVEVTGGPVNNVQLVTLGDNEFSPVTMGVAYEAYTGQGWADQTYEDIRVIWPMYQSLLHWWVMPDDDTDSILDFAGKAISNGPAGSSPHLYGGRILEELGVEPSRIVTTHNADAANLMRDGQLIAGAGFSSVPNPTADEMSRTVGAKILGVPHDIGAPIAEKFGIGLGVIPGGTYAGQADEVETISQWSAVIAHKDLPADFVYEVTKLTFENNDRMVAVHRSAVETTLDNLKLLTGVPLHVGVIRYLEEEGIDIPDSAYPPEYEAQ